MIPRNATSKRDVQPLNAQFLTFVLPSNNYNSSQSLRIHISKIK